MKNNRVLSMLLALVLLFSLAACGNNGGGTTEAPGTGGGTPDTGYSYVTEYTQLHKGQEYFAPMLLTEDGYYSYSTIVVGKEIPEGEVEQWEGQYDVYELALFCVTDSGVKKLEGFAPKSREVDGEGKQEFYCGSDIGSMSMNSAGEFVVLEYVYAGWYEGEQDVFSPSFDDYDGYKNLQKYYIRTLSADGSELSCTELETSENEYLNTYGVQTDSKGNFVLSCESYEGGSYTLRAYAMDGTVAYEQSCEEYIERIIKFSDGSLALLSWGDNGYKITPLDEETGSLGEAVAAPNDAWDMFGSGGEYDLYYTSGVNFYGLDMESGNREKILNWINCDITGSPTGITVKDNGDISGYLIEWDDGEQLYSTIRVDIRKVPSSSLPQKQTLRLAVRYADYELTRKVVEFNRSHEAVRIEISDYSEYDYAVSDGSDSPNAPVDGSTVLFTEIMAGNVPDIISLDMLPYSQLAAKGLLTDLYELIDSDAELSREDFLPNVLSALEQDGKLYAACSGFSVNTVIGARSVVGDTPGWTFEDYYAALETMPEGCTGFDIYMSKEDILRDLLFINMDSFVDWSTGKCSFDSPEFIELLKFTDGFIETFDWENYEWTQEDDTSYRVRNGLQMLMQTGIYSVDELFYSNSDTYFGGVGSTTFIGYPCSEGTGNYLRLGNSYGISAGCADKAAAWEFVRQFMTEEYQRSGWQLPTNVKVYTEKLEDAAEIHYLTDSQGNFILDENGEKVPETRGWLWDELTGEETPVYCLSQEQLGRIDELVRGTTKVLDENNSIFDIVLEQAKAYFAGQKSAEEVARLIQSKANIFVNEQR